MSTQYVIYYDTMSFYNKSRIIKYENMDQIRQLLRIYCDADDSNKVKTSKLKHGGCILYEIEGLAAEQKKSINATMALMTCKDCGTRVGNLVLLYPQDIDLKEVYKFMSLYDSIFHKQIFG